MKNFFTKILPASAFINRQQALHLLRTCPYFDARWYNRTYNHDFTIGQALNYWYTRGWRAGENPSVYFDTNFYMTHYHPRYNPLLHFLLEGRYQCFYPSDHHFSLAPNGTPPNLTAWPTVNHSSSCNKIVYTCITGQYDQLISPTFVAPDWQYVCFTNNPDYLAQKNIGAWEIRPLQSPTNLNPTRTNRYHKLQPHVLFPDASATLYLDGNIDVLTGARFF